jgi:hypothetical protein
MNIIKIIELIGIIIVGSILLLGVIFLVKIIMIKKRSPDLSYNFIISTAYEVFTCKKKDYVPSWCKWFRTQPPPLRPPSQNSTYSSLNE